MDSFDSVKSFLQSKLPYSEQGGTIRCEIHVQPHNKKYPRNINITFCSNIPCYSIEDTIFKGYGFSNVIRSDKNIFKWDEANMLLSVEENGIKLILKRI